MAKRSIRRASLVVLGCVILVALLGCERCVGETAQPPQQRPTTIMLVRHAEVAEQTEDPPLSAKGYARAQALAHVAGNAGVTAIFATQFIRTQETVQPLATYLGLTINQIDAEDVEGLVDQILSDHTGEVVLVAGHSPTVPETIQALGGDRRPPIPANEYDRLYVVTVDDLGKATVLHLNYGEPD